MKRAKARLAAEQQSAPRRKRSDFELNTVATRPTASSRQNEICRENHLRGPPVCFNWNRRFANRCRSFELAGGRWLPGGKAAGPLLRQNRLQPAPSRNDRHPFHQHIAREPHDDEREFNEWIGRCAGRLRWRWPLRHLSVQFEWDECSL